VKVRKPEEKRLFARARHRWEDTVKVDPKEMESEDVY
jgi:hypothetical protein